MKLSHNWLKDYLQHDLPPEKVAETLTNTGLEVEHFSKTSTIPGSLEGIVIGRVEEVRQHPNADKLKLTKVDTGNSKPLQIVCGAPNVAEGQKVLVAPPGTTLHPVKGDSFEITKKKIRGEVSEGMICAEDEVGLGHAHDGIKVMDDQAKVGTPAANYFEIEEEAVYEIDLTPNRAEAMSHIGSARDLMAAVNVNTPGQYKLRLPFPTSFQPDNHNHPIRVEVKNTEACPRYSGLTISNIKVQESPRWLKDKLISVGVKPINNIVDVTNFILKEAGQPLHAFDAEKIAGGKVFVQTLPEGTTLKTLDEETRKLTANDLMICDAEGGICLAGVFGCADSGITEETTSIFLESAYFAPQYIRKTSFHHNLRTDAAIRYEKGADPNLTIKALQRAALLIKEVAGGEISSDVIDIYPEPIPDHNVQLRFQSVKKLTGLNIPAKTIQNILTDLGIQVEQSTEDALFLKVPPFRVDVTREADVIEEILRIYGYDQISMPEQLTTSLSFSEGMDKDGISRDISSYLSANGFFQIMNSSITNTKYYEKLPISKQKEVIPLLNSMSSELNALRSNMVFSGLETISYNQNQGQQGHRYFESGRIYWKEDDQYRESEQLTIMMAGRRNGEGWHQWADDLTDFYHLKAYVLNILQRLGIGNWEQTNLNNPLFDYGLAFSSGEDAIVEFGKVSQSLLSRFEIRPEVFYAEFNFEHIVSLVSKESISFKELPKYPQVRRDLSVLIKKGVNFEELRQIATEVGGQLLEKMTLFDIYQGKQIEEGTQSLCFRLTFRDLDKTLTDQEVDKIMNELMDRYQNELNAQIR